MKTEPTEKEKLIELLEVGISNCQDDLDAASWAYEEGILISKRDAAALLDLAQSSPKIKQLEWEEDDLFADIIVSEGFSLQFYEIKIIDNTLYIGDTEQSFKTIDDAKAAAQADFEKRIKECLD